MLFSEDVRKHPGCYFDTILSAEMGAPKTINVEHNGATFRFVNSFLVSNSLPKCPATGHITLDEKTLNAVASQAKIFVLPKLSEACEQGLKDLRSRSSDHSKNVLLTERNLPIATSDSLMVQSLRQLWRPLNLCGTLEKGQFEKTLFKESSVEKIDLNVLISTASIIRAPDAPIQEHVFELGSFMFDEKALEEVAQKIQLAPLFPDRFVELRPRKLQILCVGAPQHTLTPSCSPTTEKDAILGTVEVILNSAYTGGELEVVCDDHSTHLKTASYSWVAMRADATCSVRPVTSGARLSLIYDVVETQSAGDGLQNVWKSYLEGNGQRLLFPWAWCVNPNVDKLVALAKNLPINQASTNYFQIDGRLCNDEDVQAVVTTTVERAAELLKRDIAARANRLEIHLPGASYSRYKDAHTPGSGYLGSIVAILNKHYEGGEMKGTFEAKEERFYPERGLTIIIPANTVYSMSEITEGARVSLVCDIFDKHMLHQHTLELDPLSLVNNDIASDSDSSSNSSSDSHSDSSSDSDNNRYCDGGDWSRSDDESYNYSDTDYDSDSDSYAGDATTVTTVPPTITRSCATPAVRDMICTSLSATLAEHIAVIITLQNLQPTEVFFNQTDFTVLQGGDLALYETLTSNNDYDVELVKVTLHSRFDLATSKHVLSQATATEKEDISTSLLLVPTKLTDAHRVRGKDSVYEVSGLKVTKRV